MERGRRLSWSSFGVQDGEEQTVPLMLAHSAAMGFGTVFFETAASALFLGKYGAQALPSVYLASAAAAAATGVLFSRLQRRLSFSWLMTGTLLCLALVAGGFRAAFSVTSAAWLAFLALVFYRIISILTDLEYWAVAGRIYDLRQAKRLFGFIGTGEVIARILGAFSIPLFLRMWGVLSLFVASATALFACFFLARRALKAASVDAAGTSQGGEGKTERPALATLFGESYLRLVLIVAFFGVLGKYLVDFAFLQQVRTHFSDTAQVASFLGVFSGISQTASLLARLLVSGRLLALIGVHRGLLVLPLLHVVCTAAVLLSAAFPNAEGAIFALVVLNQGLYKTFKHPIDNPALKVLYQPIPKGERLSLAIAIEALLTPMGIAISGGLMTLFATVFAGSQVRFSGALFAIFVAWLLAASRTASRYKDALTHALKGRLEDVAVAFDDESAVRALTQKIVDGSQDEALAALQLLGDKAPNSLRPLLSGLLSHAAPGVREAAIERIAALKPEGVAEQIEVLINSERDPKVLARALRALAELDPDRARTHLEAFADAHQPLVSEAALLGLLLADPDKGQVRVATLVRGDAASRQRAARLLRYSKAGGGDALVETLMGDENPDVAREAMLAAGTRDSPRLLGLVVSHAGQKPLDGAARSALALAGVRAFPQLATAFETPTTLLRRRALGTAIAAIQTPEVCGYLVEQLPSLDVVTRLHLLRRLNRLRAVAPPTVTKTVSDLLLSEAQLAMRKMAIARDLSGTDSVALLEGAMRGSYRNARERILFLLALSRDFKAIAAARTHLESAEKERRAYAREILDVVLSREERESLLPAIEGDLDALATKHRSDPGLAPHSVAARVSEALGEDPLHTETWVRATALHAAAALKGGEMASAVRSFLQKDENRSFSNTGEISLSEILGEPEKTRKGPMLLVERVVSLKAVEMFSKVPEDLLADVAAIAEEVAHPANDLVFAKGQEGQSLYVIVRGSVRVHDGDREIARLGEKTVFGELALLDPEPRSASVTTITDAHFLKLDREAFLELMLANEEVVRGILTVLCERVRNMSRALRTAQAGG